MSFHAKFRSWYPDIARLTGRFSVENRFEEVEECESFRGLGYGVLVLTSMVRFDSPDTSTVNMIAVAPRLSTFRMRVSEAERSLLR
jgi:hypothetical protein